MQRKNCMHELHVWLKSSEIITSALCCLVTTVMMTSYAALTGTTGEPSQQTVWMEIHIQQCNIWDAEVLHHICPGLHHLLLTLAWRNPQTSMKKM